mmetsp:Transcript_1638/g.2650  ORF Transcript_1638/g.2650 Transcript_1638/m.2650 type:complete len:98 (+) Transcript_1638:258-551(+)
MFFLAFTLFTYVGTTALELDARCAGLAVESKKCEISEKERSAPAACNVHFIIQNAFLFYFWNRAKEWNTLAVLSRATKASYKERREGELSTSDNVLP